MFSWQNFYEYIAPLQEIGVVVPGYKIHRKNAAAQFISSPENSLICLQTPQGQLKWFKMAGQDDYLGDGSFGKVKQVTDEAGYPYALKIIAVDTRYLQEQHEQIDSELNILNQLNRLVASGARHSNSGNQQLIKFYIVDKIAPGKVLDEYINKHSNKLTIDLANQKKILYILFAKTVELHLNNIVHSDLHTENIMLNIAFDKALTLTIIDFGEALHYPEDPLNRENFECYYPDYNNLRDLYQTHFDHKITTDPLCNNFINFLSQVRPNTDGNAILAWYQQIIMLLKSS